MSTQEFFSSDNLFEEDDEFEKEDAVVKNEILQAEESGDHVTLPINTPPTQPPISDEMTMIGLPVSVSIDPILFDEKTLSAKEEHALRTVGLVVTLRHIYTE